MINVGRVVFALSLAAIGLLSLGSGDFGLNWQPVPAWVPWRTPLAYASGFVMVAGGLGILFKRTAPMAAVVLAVHLLLWLVLLQLPRVAAHPGTEVTWLGFGETLTLVAAGWILAVTLTGPNDGQSLRVGRFLFAAALLPIGLSHLVYVQPTTALVPAWLPFRVGIVYVTGTAQIAAGLAILLGVLPRLAATLEASALALFALLVWVPRVAAAPTSRFQATAFLITAAVSGAAWVVAGSLDGVPWSRVAWAKSGESVVVPANAEMPIGRIIPRRRRSPLSS